MTQFLTTHGVAFEIEKVITTARERLILLTPYLKLSPILLERLRDAGRRVPTVIVYGKSELSAQEVAKCRLIPGLSLQFCEHLHAKCYVNEARLVITSMNLHEFSEKNNREMGVVLTSDEPAYQDAIREVDSILTNSSLVELVNNISDSSQSERITSSRPSVRDLTVLVVGPPVPGQNPHLVCQVAGIGKVAFWGTDHINDLRQRAGDTPFVVRCACRSANSKDGATSHDAWVPQTPRLRFL